MVDCIHGDDFMDALVPIINDSKILIGSFIDATLMYVIQDSIADAHHMMGVGKSLDSRTWIRHIPRFRASSCNVVLACI